MEYGSNASAAAALIFLAAAAYEDYKTEKISMILIMTGAVISIAAAVINKDNIMQILYGILTGNAILLIGYASREAVGYGDGLIFIITGIFLGWMNNIVLIAGSLLLAAVCSMILMALRIKKRTDRIAFVPFILGAYVLMKAMSV